MRFICKKKTKQQGFIIILLPFLLLILLGLAALVVDLGLAYNARTQLQQATDNAALAAALELQQQKPEELANTVQLYLQNNPIDNSLARDVEISLGVWDDETQGFTATQTNPNAVKVSASYTGSFYFAANFYTKNYTITRSSIASLVDNRPLNVMLVVDLSANMSLASQLQGVGIDDVSQSSAVNNLNQIYQFFNNSNLFSKESYGNMSIDQVIRAADGLSEEQTALNTLGLNELPYPYTGFSWLDYIQYVMQLSWSNSAYQHHYGFLTLINFWQEKAYAANQTPILAQAPEQPLQTVKNAVRYFSTKLNPTSDRLGLTLIASTSNLAQDLTNTYSEINTQLNNYQAGHFGAPDGTISPAIDSAQDSLINNPSPNGKKIILLFANGQTLWDSNSPNVLYDVSSLKANSIYAYEVVIGPASSPTQSAYFTSATDGLQELVTLGSTDYTAAIDAIYEQLKLGPPRLVQ